MSKYAAPIEVINAALARMGAQPLQDLSARSKPAIIANELYEAEVRNLMARHRWSFCIREETLTYQGATEGLYSSVFVLPPDCISLVNVTVDGGLIDYRLEGAKVLCNQAQGTNLRALYSYRANEGDWADDFAMGVVMMLHAHFVRALREEGAEADRLESRAEVKLATAMVRDRRQSPPTPVMRTNRSGLAEVWRGGV